MTIERTDLQQLREYLAPLFENLKERLERVYEQGIENSRVIRSIEQSTSTSITALNKDMERHDLEISALKIIVKELQTRFEGEDKVDEKRWEEQASVNKDVEIIKKFLWAIFVTTLGILLTFIWSLIVNGGIAGLLK